MDVRHAGAPPFRYAVPLLGITLLGAALRLHDLGRASIWLDEARSFQVASGSLQAILADRGGLNPPLYDLLLHAWISLFGRSEAALRSLSAILGSAAVVLMGLVGRRLLGRGGGLLSALLLAVMVFPIHYAQDARPYSLLLAMSLGSFVFYVRLLEGEHGRDRVGYLLFTAGLCCTHSYWVFLLLAQNLHRLLFGPRDLKGLLRWAAGQAAVLLAAAPSLYWIGLSTSRVMAEGFWIPRPGWPDLLAALRTMVGFLVPPGWLMVPALLVGIGLFASWDAVAAGHRGTAPAPESPGRPPAGDSPPGGARSCITLLALWSLTPTLVPFLLSQVVTPMFWPRYAIGAVPGLYLLLARGVTRLPVRWARGAAILAVLAVSAAGLVNYHRFPGVTGRWSGSYFQWEVEAWREAVGLLARERLPGDVFLVAPDYAMPPFGYYAGSEAAALPTPATVDEVRAPAAIAGLLVSLEGKNRAWLLLRRHRSVVGTPIDTFLRAHFREIPVARPPTGELNPAVYLFDLTRQPGRPGSSDPAGRPPNPGGISPDASPSE